jgi:DNA-directed RNA polymerase subunit F
MRDGKNTWSRREKMPSREEMIYKLAEIDLDCFYNNSFRQQEKELRSIFASGYNHLTDKELADAILEYESDFEENENA